MELDHFSHEHPLQLIDELQRDDDGYEEILCDGCRKPIILGGSSAYTCKECKYILHNKCAELPKEIKHPMHLKHSLTLFSNPPYRSSKCFCNICGIKEWKWCTYHCSVCEFDVHISCALEEEDVIKHEGHHHPLTFVQRASTFLCDACRTEYKDLSYRCTTCPFWIHKTCAKLPSSITLSGDNHPLVLTFSLPNIYRNFRHECNICHEKVHPSYWIYYCELCRYFAHLKCATVEKEPLRGAESSSTAEAYLDPNLMNFPLPDNSMDVVISRFVKSISVEAVNDIARELIHFSHKQHPLMLFDDVQSDDGMINKEIQCDGCAQPISVPFYCCRQCNFFLHRCCAELPKKIFEHPSHPQHPLSLYSNRSFFNFRKCNCCKILFNGFFFWCKTCDFNLDVQCACRPKAINHDAHNYHSLQLQAQSSKYRCNATEYTFTEFRYRCETCDFNLSNYSAKLSRTFKHEWDRHPLTLSYPPFSYHPDEFICEICEEDIHPNYWLYHCRACDQSFHTRCIKPLDWYSNVKFGGTLEVENHPHPLVFVRKSKNKSPSVCSSCGESRDSIPVLECAPCNFQLCHKCVYRIVTSLPSS